MNNLKADEILKYKDSDNEYLRNSIDYFLNKDPSLNALVSDIKLGFATENSIILNSKSESEKKGKTGCRKLSLSKR